MKQSHRLLAGLVICISFYSSLVMAAPDGADLLAACTYSVQHDFQGIQGRMCKWYVIPCDCGHGDKSPPPVCLPPHVSTESLAYKVINGLKANPALQTEKANIAAAMVLAEHYPCQDYEH